jgi:flap endonuclease-1
VLGHSIQFCAFLDKRAFQDVLIFEAPLIRNITGRKDPLVLIPGDAVRMALALTQPSYIDFAILLGTDFAPRIRNVGPVRALRLIRAHERIEDVLSDPLASGVQDAETYLAAIRRAREVFSLLPPVPSPLDLEQREYDSDSVAAIMAKHGLQRYVTRGDDWDLSTALSGNYFNDSPVANQAACTYI